MLGYTQPLLSCLQKDFAMPRKARMYLPDVPAYIVQRGNNRNACFFAEQDYAYYLEVLAQGLRRLGAIFMPIA